MSKKVANWSAVKKIAVTSIVFVVMILIAVLVATIGVRQNDAREADELAAQKGLIAKVGEECMSKASGDETIDYSDDGKNMTIFEPVDFKADDMTGFACVKKKMDMWSVEAKDLEALKVYGKIYGGTDSETWDHWEIVWEKDDDGTTATITYTGNENYR